MLELSTGYVGDDSSMKKDIEKDLLSKGYHQFKPSGFDGECVTDCYQTAIRNSEGDREYFITWRKWDFSRYNYNNDSHLDEPAYEAETHLNTHDKNVIDITFHNGWEPEAVEEFMKKLFATGWFLEYDNR